MINGLFINILYPKNGHKEWMSTFGLNTSDKSLTRIAQVAVELHVNKVGGHSFPG